MTKQLKKLIEEFQETKARVDDMHHRQAKELQSMQNAIREVANAEKLSDEERQQVSEIINITDEWWCND